VLLIRSEGDEVRTAAVGGSGAAASPADKLAA
jgi:hypothetical protein